MGSSMSVDEIHPEYLQVLSVVEDSACRVANQPGGPVLKRKGQRVSSRYRGITLLGLMGRSVLQYWRRKSNF